MYILCGSKCVMWEGAVWGECSVLCMYECIVYFREFLSFCAKSTKPGTICNFVRLVYFLC